jgi:hypothetical protein
MVKEIKVKEDTIKSPVGEISGKGTKRHVVELPVILPNGAKEEKEVYITANSGNLKNFSQTEDQIKEAVSFMWDANLLFDLLKEGKSVREGMKLSMEDQLKSQLGDRELYGICPVLKALFAAGITGYFYHGKDEFGGPAKWSIRLSPELRKELKKKLEELAKG